MTDLSGTQISSLLETLPGIAQVLRSPVADAFIGLIRAGTRQAEFDLGDAEEVMRYAVRRNLISADESEQILAEARRLAGPAKPRPPEKAKGAAVKAKAPAQPAKPKVVKKPATKAAARSGKKAARPAARKVAKKSVKKAARPAARAGRAKKK